MHGGTRNHVLNGLQHLHTGIHIKGNAYEGLLLCILASLLHGFIMTRLTPDERMKRKACLNAF